eukprot:5534413-Alexandrium_andersonii.AAC.1
MPSWTLKDPWRPWAFSVWPCPDLQREFRLAARPELRGACARFVRSAGLRPPGLAATESMSSRNESA